MEGALTQPCVTCSWAEGSRGLRASCGLPKWIEGLSQLRSLGTWWQRGMPIGKRGAHGQRCASEPKVWLLVPFAHF